MLGRPQLAAIVPILLLPSFALGSQACPSGGATLKIHVTNGSEFTGNCIRVKGRLLSPSCDSSTLATSYGGGGSGEQIPCGSPDPVGLPVERKEYSNLKPGIWVHEVTSTGKIKKGLFDSAEGTQQRQFFKNRMVGGNPNRIYWIVPRWLQEVGNNSNSGATSLRQALLDANAETGNPNSQPYLIQLKEDLTAPHPTPSPKSITINLGTTNLPNLSRNRVTVDLSNVDGDPGVDINGGAQCRSWTIQSSHNNLLRFKMRDIGNCQDDLLVIDGGDDNVLDGLILTNTLSANAGRHRLRISGGAGGTAACHRADWLPRVAGGRNCILRSEMSAAGQGNRGVVVSDSGTNARFEYNRIRDNKEGGLQVIGGATVEAFYNHIHSNDNPQTDASGITVVPSASADGGTLTARWNLIEANGGRGIFSRCKQTLTVQGVVSQGNSATGISFTNIDGDSCPGSPESNKPIGTVSESNFNNNIQDGAVVLGRHATANVKFGENTSTGRNAFTRNGVPTPRRNFANRTGSGGGTPVNLKAVNNQWQSGHDGSSCTGTCLCASPNPNTCRANCTASICQNDIHNDTNATTDFGPPMMYRAGSPQATSVYPSVPLAIGDLQWIHGSNFNSIEGKASGGNTCSPVTGNCTEVWLGSSSPLAALTPLGDAPASIVVLAPINCSQPTFYHANKLQPASTSEYPQDAVVTWCENP